MALQKKKTTMVNREKKGSRTNAKTFIEVLRAHLVTEADHGNDDEHVRNAGWAGKQVQRSKTPKVQESMLQKIISDVLLKSPLQTNLVFIGPGSMLPMKYFTVTNRTQYITAMTPRKLQTSECLNFLCVWIVTA